jgi:outer membrane protein assembly factor BamB
MTTRAADWPMFRGGQALNGVAEGALPDKLALLWAFKTGGPVRSSAAIVSGQVFIGSNDGSLYALGLVDGRKAWTLKTEGAVESSPLVLEGKVFVGSSDGTLYALDTHGKLVWKYATGEKILGAPNWLQNAGARLILVGSYDYRLHCVDAMTGKSNWVYETGNYINGSPAVTLGAPASSPASSGASNAPKSAGEDAGAPMSHLLGVFGGCDGLLHVLALADGKEEKEIEAGAYIAGSVALAGGRAYFGQFENEFLCVDLNEGKIAWTFHDRNFPYFSSPAVTKEQVVFGGRDKLLHCVKLQDGSPLWSFPTKGKVDSSPVVCGEKVVVGSDDGRVYVVSLDKGKQLWSYEIGQPVGSSPAVADGKIVIGSDDGSVYCFGAKGK